MPGYFKNMQTVWMSINKLTIYSVGFQCAKQETLFSLMDLILLLSSKVLHFWSIKKWQIIVTYCAERVNVAGLRLLSLERPACKVGPWLASGNLDLGRVLTSPRTDKNDSWFLGCLCKQRGLCCTPALLWGVWDFGTCQAEGACVCDQLAIQTLGLESLMKFPGRQHCVCPVTTHCWLN